MSQGLNKTQIIGYLGKNPESNGNGTVTRFSVGVTERWKDREGEEQEHTEWYRVVTFNGMAENCAKYLARGRRVYVEGRLRTRTYTNRDDEEKTTTELLAASVIFLDAPRQEGAQKPEERPSPGKPRPAESTRRGTSAGIPDDDIPF